MAKIGIYCLNEKINEVLIEYLSAYQKDEYEFVTSLNTLKEKVFNLVIYNFQVNDQLSNIFQIADIQDNLLVMIPSELQKKMANELQKHHIITIEKPLKKQQLKVLIDALMILVEREEDVLKKNQNYEKKLNELKYQYQAKCLLIEKKKMSEKEAHRYIEKKAMDTRMTKMEISLRIIQELERV